MLVAFTARTTRVSNPVCSPRSRPSLSDPFWLDAFATGSLLRIIAFYRSPKNTSNPSWSLVVQFLLLVARLSPAISQKIYITSYGRFRPNKRFPLVALVLPRRLAPVFPTTYSPRFLFLTKAYAKHKHLGFPYHTFVHCRGFAPAAPRRARASFSVPFSGLPLSRPVPIIGLVSLYLANNLIDRRLILRHCFSRKIHSSIFPLLSVILSFPRLSLT